MAIDDRRHDAADGQGNADPHDAQAVARAAEILAPAETVVVLTGAGVSAESGVPTFREAQTGYWSRFDPETLASPRGFASDPGLVWRWYMERFGRVGEVAPNPGHFALAALEERITVGGRHPGRFLLLTQNVDDLHERAGSRNVRHLHGSIARYRCDRCGEPHALRPGDRKAEEPPRCVRCGANIRPDVVWFGECLPEEVLREAWAAALSCPVMLVAGTSGQVHPAATLPRIARGAGASIIDINPEPTPISDAANVFLQGPSGVVLPRLLRRLQAADRRPS